MSRFPMPAVALLTLVMAACAPQPDEQEQAIAQSEQRAEEAAQPAPPEPATTAAACDDSQAQWAIGKKATDADVEQAENSPINALIEGVQLTMRDLLNTFSRHGMKPLAPQAGDAFDPLLHEAMFEAPLPGTKAGDIIQVMTEGFLLHDRLLRPAQVGVSSTPKS